MNITVASLYQDAADAVLKEANGELTFALFNRLSKIAEINTIDYITGSLTGATPPEPYTTQKVRDWASVFIVPHTAHIQDGYLSQPKDYYGFENLSLIGAPSQAEDCDDEQETPQVSGNTPIPLLDGEQFDSRCRTYIEELKPSFSKPIAKQVGTRFEFFPKDVGAVKLEYYRYPKFASIVPAIDPVYNNEIIGAGSTDYEWGEKARGLLIWFIVDRFANRTSNQAMKEFNNATQKVHE